MDRRVQEILILLQSDFSKELSVSEMARFVNLSVSRFSHVFKSDIGVAPAKYLKTLRMGKGREFLEITFLSVKEIIIRIGLKDESHFVQDFKRTYGLTPTQYRVKARLLISIGSR